MSDDGKRRGLGRGLSALLGEDAMPMAPPPAGVRSVPIERLHRGRFQPRRNFDEASLQALVDSVIAQGILQPLLVRRHPEMPEDFEILAGERRWRAAQRAKLHEVPVVVREMGDREALEAALVENVQREDLSAIEEGAGYQRLIAEFGHTQEALARAVGKSRSHIANSIRLLALPEEVRAMVEDGRLTAGHARALLSADDALALAREVVKDDMTVRQVERRVQSQQARLRGGPPPPLPDLSRLPAHLQHLRTRDPDIVALEHRLSLQLGLIVAIKTDPTGTGGTITFRFDELAQFDELMRRLRGE